MDAPRARYSPRSWAREAPTLLVVGVPAAPDASDRVARSASAVTAVPITSKRFIWASPDRQALTSRWTPRAQPVRGSRACDDRSARRKPGRAPNHHSPNALVNYHTSHKKSQGGWGQPVARTWTQRLRYLHPDRGG